ncbi:NAD(P)-binding protein [Aspergillus saccharolyticus JOP 1030-1]|uniref:NAD(P)-binding protein n=1 Tax=Aspergillus saccharolyticus JOP 1030-1 TaxID=1450539 RepID=A0A318ZVU1_9EURO|nr:NAD(P)-binding protein [Aspergillus saccharolyticus JOP 1030-1]PYH44248.1 NAD(P)-binding protein [Aspergillus saccharolyticus JOP 1030-1]
MSPRHDPQQVALIGLGTIGNSMAALHLSREDRVVNGFDICGRVAHLQGSLANPFFLVSACASASIIQVQGPESVEFKQALWAQVEAAAPASAHLLSSTSGIAASIQQVKMRHKTRLLVVHPFHPPHIMPLLGIVPASDTLPERIEFARTYFSVSDSRHRPVVIRKEIPGFVGNRLALTLLRKACYLVQEDVVDAWDLDTI